MSSNTPSTPVKVPSSAANHTQATLDPDLRSQINTLLLRDGHVAKIQDALLHALNSHSTNWPTAIQTHALNLLRSGEVTTFPALLSRVLEDVRHDSALNPMSSSSNGTSAKSGANGDGPKANGAADGKPNLAVPESVVEEALRVTRESLEAVCEIEDEGAA
ncbi:Ff.00g082480.m01.CDS01 [Fusarium sp. VM40]|nr:Ff.00g082480.m01.CDS01 [Fusarium sp. VM40]